MTAATLAAWLVALPVRPCFKAHATNVARIALLVGRKSGVSPRLLGAVACYESRGRLRLLHRNVGASCDVGPWQVNCHRCSVQCRERYQPALRNAARAAFILRLGRALCRRRPGLWYCKQGRPHCRYNPGSRRWCRDVTRNWRSGANDSSRVPVL